MSTALYHKPIIGISGTRAHTKSVRAMMSQMRSQGAHVVFLDSQMQNITAESGRDMLAIDALVLMGNDLDIDPKRYIDRYPEGDAKRHVHPQTRSELNSPVTKIRARYEEAMLKRALACGMPVLGICGGLHRINVFCGGTLHQHIPDLVGCDKHMQHKQGIAPHIPIVPIIIKCTTKLSEISAGISMPFVKSPKDGSPQVIMENSMHHQAVDRVAPDFRVCAVTDSVKLGKGVAGYMVEAIEADPEGAYGKQFILGVQWHPEFSASSVGERIVQHFVRATHDFLKKRHIRKRFLAFKKVGSIHGI